jgi:hypothetical protein
MRKEGFSYYFCLTIEGYGSGTGSRAGSVPRFNGSGFGRPKTFGRIRILIRIPNTAFQEKKVSSVVIALWYFFFQHSRKKNQWSCLVSAV